MLQENLRPQTITRQHRKNNRDLSSYSKPGRIDSRIVVVDPNNDARGG